jgi:Xaa-Pro aminopeptidase
MERFSRAKAALATHGLSAVIIQSPENLLYCTNFHLSQGTLCIGKEVSTLFLDARYYGLAKGKKLPFEVVLLHEPKELYPLLEKAFKMYGGPIGFDDLTLTVASYEKIKACAVAASDLVPVPSYFRLLRRQKQPYEIVAIERSCALCEKGLSFLLEELQPGVTEKTLAARLKAFWFEHGADSISFPPIIAFDKNSSIPHWSPSEEVLRKNSTVLIDIGVCIGDYHSDMTRVVFYGTPDEELEKCFEIIKGAYEKAFSFASQGVTPHHLDSIAREFIAHRGYGDFFVHGLGHGVGLQIHESPRLNPAAAQEEILQVGDVITIEPGIYLPGRGGVRLENTIVIEQQGPRSLIKFPIEPIFLP